MPQLSELRQRLIGQTWYQRVPCDPAPDLLADQLREAKVHKAAARRLDTFDRYAQQHSEHRKALTRGIIGAVSIALGLSPALPGTYHACSTAHDLDCGLRIGAILGGAAALGVGIWAIADLASHPMRLSQQADKLSQEIERDMQRKHGHAPVPGLFGLYQGMSPHERQTFKERLHDHVKYTHLPTSAEAGSALAV